MNSLEERIGYRFKDTELLKHALTHSSYINEHGLEKEASNERLEFLGDAILEMVSSEFLYHQYPDRQEGAMSKLRASLVCEPALAQCARELGLGPELYMGRGMEQLGGRDMDSIISDAFEALIAAMYLDGGEKEARAMIYTHVLSDTERRIAEFDPKTALQEMLQAGSHQLSYSIVGEAGPEHDKVFIAGAFLDGKQVSKGEGRSKKQAEQQAASEMIKLIRNHIICI